MNTQPTSEVTNDDVSTEETVLPAFTPSPPFSIRVISPDGDYSTDSSSHSSIADAIIHASEFGSKWIFYPLHVITDSFNFIADVPPEPPQSWIGHPFPSLLAQIKAYPNPNQLALYMQDGVSLFIHPETAYTVTPHH